MTRIVLGSASAGRLQVLRQAGIDPLVIVSRVDEDAVIAKQTGADPAEIVGALAAAKADDVALRVPRDVAADCVVIGCDSMLYVDGRLHGKPPTIEAARELWSSIANRAGTLHTGHRVVRLRDGTVTHQDGESACTIVHFGSPSPDELAAYLSTGEPLKVAGGFTLDGLGGWFVDGIEGDPSNVIGLSLPLTRRLLTRVGVSIGMAWAANPMLG